MIKKRVQIYSQHIHQPNSKQGHTNIYTKTPNHVACGQSPPNVPLSPQIAVAQPTEATGRPQVLVHQCQSARSTAPDLVGMVGPAGAAVVRPESHHNRRTHHQHSVHADSRLVSENLKSFILLFIV